MPEQPIVLTNPINDPVPDSTAHFWLAVLILLIYQGLIMWFSYRPSLLPQPSVDRILQGMNDLVLMAWIWYFQKKT